MKKFFFLFFLFKPLLGYSATIATIKHLNFGTIIAHPSGESIRINASTGSAVPIAVSGRNSVVTGGSSAQLRLTPDQAGQFITMDYPVSITLTAGSDNMSITHMLTNSTNSFTTISTSPVDLYFGGILHILSGQAGKIYTGTATININIHNP